MVQLSIIHKIVHIKSQTTFHFFVIGHFGRKPFSLLIVVHLYRYMYLEQGIHFYTKFVWLN